MASLCPSCLNNRISPRNMHILESSNKEQLGGVIVVLVLL